MRHLAWVMRGGLALMVGCADDEAGDASEDSSTSKGNASAEQTSNATGSTGSGDTVEGSTLADDEGASTVANEASTAGDTGGTGEIDDTSDATATVQTDGEDTGSDTDTDTGEPPSAASRWLVTFGTGPSVVDLHEPTRRFSNLRPQPTGINDGAAFPWSSDGRWLAEVRDDGALALYDLHSEDLAAIAVPHDPAWDVLGFAGDRGVVATTIENGVERIVSLVAPDGEVTALLQLAAQENPWSFTIAPDGQTAVYDLNVEGAYDVFGVDLSAPGSNPFPLLEGAASPTLSTRWSRDSRWLAMGFSGPLGEISGIYLWSPRLAGEPARVSPEGATYNPLFGFSPAVDRGFVTFDSFPDSTFSLSHRFTAATLGDATTLRGPSESVSPHLWSSSGEFVLYADGDSGYVQPIGTDGPGTALELPGYEYGCPIAWVDRTTFIYQSCADEAPELRLANALDPGTPAAMGYGEVSVRVEGSCMVLWDTERLYIGAPSANPVVTMLDSPDPIQDVALDPSGDQLVWLVPAGAYRQPLAQCVPQGEPFAIDDLDASTTAIGFLPAPT